MPQFRQRRHDPRVGIAKIVASARENFADTFQPRDDFERAIMNALGEISWNEAAQAIEKHRAADSASGGAT